MCLDHLVSYDMPQGENRGKIELSDFLYDGQSSKDGYLSGKKKSLGS